MAYINNYEQIEGFSYKDFSVFYGDMISTDGEELKNLPKETIDVLAECFRKEMEQIQDDVLDYKSFAEKVCDEASVILFDKQYIEECGIDDYISKYLKVYFVDETKTLSELREKVLAGILLDFIFYTPVFVYMHLNYATFLESAVKKNISKYTYQQQVKKYIAGVMSNEYVMDVKNRLAEILQRACSQTISLNVVISQQKSDINYFEHTHDVKNKHIMMV